MCRDDEQSETAIVRRIYSALGDSVIRGIRSAVYGLHLISALPRGFRGFFNGAHFLRICASQLRGRKSGKAPRDLMVRIARAHLVFCRRCGRRDNGSGRILLEDRIFVCMAEPIFKVRKDHSFF